MRPLWTPKETAEYLGVKESTLRQWRRLRKGPPFIRVSGTIVRYDPAQVWAWLEERGAKAARGEVIHDDPDAY